MHGTLLDPQLSQPPLPRYARILAFDLGKFNSVLCRFDPATAADWRIPPLAPASGRVARPKAGANGGIRAAAIGRVVEGLDA